MSEQRRISRYYNLVPNFIYDFLMQLGEEDKYRSLVFDKLEITPGSSVLEVCIGTGLNISHYPTGAHYLGLDINPKMLRAALRRKNEAYNRQINLIRGNALHLPFQNDAFDVAIISYGLSVVPDQAGTLSEIKRVVKADGSIGILDYTASSRLPGQVRLDLPELISRMPLPINFAQDWSNSGIGTSIYILGSA